MSNQFGKTNWKTSHGYATEVHFNAMNLAQICEMHIGTQHTNM